MELAIMVKRNYIYYLILIQTILLYFLPSIRTNFLYIDIVFGLLSFATFMIIVVNARHIRVDAMGIWLFVFFIICSVYAYNVLIGKVSLVEYIRGLIPFSWFIYYFLYTNFMKKDELNKLLKALYYVALLSSMTVILYFVIFVSLNAYSRVTFYYVNSTVPFSILAVLFSISKVHENKGIKRYYFFLVIGYTSVLLTETKSLLISTVIGVVFLLLSMRFDNKGEKAKFIISILLIIALLTFSLFSALDIGKRWNFLKYSTENEQTNEYLVDSVKNEYDYVFMYSTENEQTNEYLDENAWNLFKGLLKQRINPQSYEIMDKGSVSVRIMEFSIALSELKGNYMFGNGLGYEYDASELGYGSDKVGYMHNIIAYFMLDFGILGLILLISLIRLLIVQYLRNMKQNACSKELINHNALIGAVILSFAVYANFFAMIRSIHFNYMIIFFIAMLSLMSNNERKKVNSADSSI